ncbi:hypothetical protein [Nostoc sp. FACHB-133]|uniref:hypothetical protein n=1 Tax=Nostoc sp. FACHB-133 TaxID=2692835 RepID=UPI001688DA55|nr:hypothetical protein [Nostoc sp. FACHB-133]MBD2522123.1 hypothetical protein [Nostoc sp. FACHB-133]
MKIDFDWLNRIGIVLNFLAGFMLAPDLIGKDKAQIIENYIDRIATFTTNSLRNRIHQNILNEFSNTNLRPLYYFALSFSWFITIIFFSAVKIGIQPDLLSAIFMRFMSLYFLITSVYATFILVPLFLIDIARTIENLAEKDNTFTSLLTIGGIIFFIVGNLFQFIASFK